MADNLQGDGKNNAQLLQELEALSQTLYQSHTARRTASFPRTAAPPPPEGVSAVAQPDQHPRERRREPRPARTRRMSLSPWRSRPRDQPDGQDDDRDRDDPPARRRGGRHPPEEPAASSAGEKNSGIWGWKPMRALSHIGMQRLGCLFSVEVVSVQGLPASMNGLRLCVAVRKKDSKDGMVQTMPSRVLQGCADFEETLFLRCHIYCTGGGGGGKPLKFEPRPFLISAIAVDAPELDFGRSAVDLSLMVRDSIEKNFEGARVREWDRSFDLSGKARGGEMVLKLGFQIMEDGGVGVYNQPPAEGGKSGRAAKGGYSPLARRHSKSSFSVTSPRVSTRPAQAITPSPVPSAVDFRGIDDFNLDEPAPAPPSSSPSVQRSEPDARLEDLDLPDFEIVDRGVEVLAGADGGGKEEEAAERDPEAAEGEDAKSAASGDAVVKEMVVSDPIHRIRLTELDSIAKQIAALESMMAGGDAAAAALAAEEKEVVRGLDADEETVTREFLQMLELEGGEEWRLHDSSGAATPSRRGAEEEAGGMAFVPDLGKGLGSVVQTKDGGYLAAMNPFNTEVRRQETPKLAMQISKPMVIGDKTSASGFELFQRMAAPGADELASALTSLTAMDDLKGKTAEQIAFEGIASAIISGRNTEGASSSSSAAKSISAVKAMVEAMGAGRKERLATGIWNVSEEPVTATEVLAFVLQKVEAMAVEALKIQAGMAEEEAPFEVFAIAGKGGPESPLAAAVTLEEIGAATGGGKRAGLTLLVVVQMRDPVRGYEAVGGPVVAVAQAAAAEEGGGEDEEEEEEGGYKVGSLHMAGLRGGRGRRGAGWDAERQRLTAAQWVVGNGMGGGKATAAAAAAGKERRPGKGGRGAAEAVMWSMSARVMAGMWLKPVRNPDVKFNRERETG